MTEESMSKQAKIDWGNVPSWIATMVAVITLLTGLGGGKVLSDKQNEGTIQTLRESLEPLEKEKERLDAEIKYDRDPKPTMGLWKNGKNN